MTRSPMSVKGFRRLLDGVTDQVLRAEEKKLAARVVITIQGDFELERDTELGGELSGVVPVSGVPVQAGGSAGLKVSQDGAGSVRVEYEIWTSEWRGAKER